MAPTPMNFDLKAVKKQISSELHNSNQRGLAKSAKWLAEMNFALNHVKMEVKSYKEHSSLHFSDPELYDTYLLVKSAFDGGEYQRCAYFSEPFSEKSSILRFLRFYALFLDCEKKRLENMTELTVVSDPQQTKILGALVREINSCYEESVQIKDFDAYDLYLLGMISRRLNNIDGATDYLIAALKSNPYMWGAWTELAFVIMDRKKLNVVQGALPDCWMKHFFLGHIYLELHMNEKALRTYFALQKAGFHKSIYIKSQIAVGYHNVQRVDEAIETYDNLGDEDPYRLDGMDLFSNMLYVKGEKHNLQVLANKAVSIDKYRVETCCIVGNLHSLKREHHKAIQYFERALKINPYYLSSWTLMGHEYMELKNSTCAIQCYREAVEVNRHDFRAWNGLGQTYDILKMPAYSLYYYKQAHRLRPNDSRLITALGEAYEKLDKTQLAQKCYERARQLGDIEGLAILRLAKMLKTADADKAARYYQEYLQEMELQNVADRDEQGKAHAFLASYFFQAKEYVKSFKHAVKCIEFPEVKEEGKNLMKLVTEARNSEPSTVNEESDLCEVVDVVTVKEDKN